MAILWTLGAARHKITPRQKVELAGLGYHLQRCWQTVRDDIAATAVVIEDSRGCPVALVGLDLMYNDAAFTRGIRERVAAAVPQLRPEGVCVNCSHSHSAPTAGWLRGAGDPDPDYLREVSETAAHAVMDAFRKRQPVWLKTGSAELDGFTFNRTRPKGDVDKRVQVLCAESEAGRPLAVIANFHAHPVLWAEECFTSISRDVPGAVGDIIEAAMPGATFLYLQGTCGDVEFLREYREPGRHDPPILALADAVKRAVKTARPVEVPGTAAVSRTAALPVRPWARQEVLDYAEEGLHRLKTGDTHGWLEGIASKMVGIPAKLPTRYGGSVEKTVAAISRFAVEWANEVLPSLDAQASTLETEVQALRVGDLYLSANASEFFTAFDLDLRRRWRHPDLMVLGYSNGTIGYLPDAFDIAQKSYAAIQSPKGLRQQPFTDASGPAMVEALAGALAAVER